MDVPEEIAFAPTETEAAPLAPETAVSTPLADESAMATDTPLVSQTTLPSAESTGTVAVTGSEPVAWLIDTPTVSGGNAGFWSFEITDGIFLDYSKVKIGNEARDNSTSYEVTVSNDIDNVTVEFDLAVGKTTTLTITKSDIDELRKWGHDHEYGDIPTLYLWGCIWTYDVDVGVRNKEYRTRVPAACRTCYRTIWVAPFTLNRHLIERGTYHNKINSAHLIELSPRVRCHIMGSNDEKIPGLDIWVNANATLTNAGLKLPYVVTAGVSEPVPGIVIFPEIWKHTDTGDVSVYTGPQSGCLDEAICVATGTYMPSDCGTYYVNATVRYTSQGYIASTKSGDITVTNLVSPQLHITGLLSVGEPVPCLENATIPSKALLLAPGSTLDHRTNGETHLIRPDGTELGWAEDAETITVPTQTETTRVSYVYIVPSGSVIAPAQTAGHVDVTDPATNAAILKTINGNVNVVDLSSNPVGVCVPKAGCGSGAATNNQYFLDTMVSSAGITGTGIPVLSDQHLKDGSQIVTMSELDSTDPAKVTTIHSDGTENGKGLTLNVVNATSGKSLFLTAKAEVTGGKAALHYTITGITSVENLGISLTPRIYKITPAGDVLMFTGEPTTCTSGTTCTVSGEFVPTVWDFSNVTSKYFMNATVSFTSSPSYKLFSAIAGDSGANRADIQPLSDTSVDAVPEVVVTGPLSPVKPGKLVGAEKSNNTVPWGGTIEHGMNGDVPMTVVYDANGTPQSQVDDKESNQVSVPSIGVLSATRVIDMPSNSTIIKKEGKNKEIYFTGERILSIKDGTPIKKDMEKLASSSNPVLGKSLNAWIEYAYDTSVTLDTFSGTWTVPSSPPAEQLAVPWSNFLFIGIRDLGTNNCIVQPVLEWHQIGQGYTWTIASWTVYENDQGYTSERRTVSVGDTISGSMTYNHDTSQWTITTTDTTTGGTTTGNSQMHLPTASNLEIDAALEGWNVTNNSRVPGDTTFSGMSFSNSGTNVPIVLNTYTTPSDLLSGLRVELVTNPSSVTLHTNN